MATFQIAANEEDGISEGRGGFEHISSSTTTFASMYLGVDDGNGLVWDGGWIFRSTGIPQGSTILTCTITLRQQSTDYIPTPTGDWWGFAVDSPNDFVLNHAHSIGDHHTRTSASVSDNIPDEDPHVSPSLVTIAQEIVNRAGFSGDLGFTWYNTGTGSKYFNVADYSDNPANAAVLTITWGTGPGQGADSGRVAASDVVRPVTVAVGAQEAG